ncbi:MAG TPA: metalloregulator ArsR/SmtB family transcription factor, partial [Steroidobacteraceae bacterium]
MASFDESVRTLRAAAEPTRLRILAVCAEGELTVGEIGQVLAQSQPRVSRHLKQLCDAGLLLRFREGHWVYYRVAAQGRGADQVAQLLAWIETQDNVLRLDRERAANVRDERARLAAEELSTATVVDDAADDELRAVLIDELGNAPLGALLDIGTGTGSILRWLAPHAREAVGVDLSSEALRVARTSVHGAGLHHCMLQQADMHELPFEANSFDVITIDRVLADARRPVLALEEAARLLRPDGRLLIIEDYDKLEATNSASGQHALRNLRDWLP